MFFVVSFVNHNQLLLQSLLLSLIRFCKRAYWGQKASETTATSRLFLTGVHAGLVFM